MRGIDVNDHTEQEWSGPFDPVLLLQILRLWQSPVVLGAMWWNSLASGWLPPTHLGRFEGHHEEHCQLVIPEPLEENGEHLVA